ncbi:MAG: sulfatase-like hydrolase/transferase [Clostridia bacterium]|nr:sulfatase-like hydrolase/transferase [Clostridia bacterium]
MISAKKYLKVSFPYVLIAFPLVMMDVFIRFLAIRVNYTQPLMIAPSILFSVFWIGLITVISISLPRLAGRTVYGIVFTVYFVLFLTNSIYFSYTDFFFSFKLLSLAEAGSSYIWSTVKGADPVIYLFGILVLAVAVLALIFFPKRKKTNTKLMVITVAAFILLHALTPLLYGKVYDTLKWDAWRNPANVYKNFNDTNKNIKICGFYEYCFRDLCKSLTDSEPKKTPKEERTLEKISDGITPHKENSYTGIFEGKNVIFLQLEGIDTWLLTEEDMPNLYKLRQESINFTRHYSYYTGGGSTFNSELAVNTGFITPVTYYRNAYTFTTNLYPRSLPKLFKAQGYGVNAFHMNTGEYYSRKLNYVNWGYDNYYGLMDIADYDDKSYELDRELILNEIFNEAMFGSDAPFMHYIISYTPHTPFATDNYRGSLLAGERYGENIPEMTEEQCARLFASETDNMVGLLIQELEEHGLLEDTVIVAFSDHYLYTLNDKSILDSNGKITENNLINHTPFMIWSKGMEWSDNNESLTVDKVNSQIDILPTVLNMFGLGQPEGYYLGQDIFSDSYSGYVFFSDYSWYDGNLYVENGEVISGEVTDPDYVTAISTRISELILKNDLIQKYDHFREIEKELSKPQK